MGSRATVWWVFLLALGVFSCGSSPVSPLDEDLSRVLSITGLNKIPIRDPENADRLVALNISVVLVNTAVVPIDVPFTFTWALRSSGGALEGSASKRLQGMDARGSEAVSFSVEFPSRENLDGVRDEVTFDALEP